MGTHLVRNRTANPSGMAKGNGENWENTLLNLLGWITNPICPETKWEWPKAVHRLLEIELGLHHKLIPVPAYAKASGPDTESTMVQQVGPRKRIQPNPNKRRRRVENRVQNTLRIVRIPGNAIRTLQRPLDLPGHDQSHVLGYAGCRTTGIHGRLPNLRKNRRTK